MFGIDGVRHAATLREAVERRLTTMSALVEACLRRALGSPAVPVRQPDVLPPVPNSGRFVGIADRAALYRAMEEPSVPVGACGVTGEPDAAQG